MRLAALCLALLLGLLVLPLSAPGGLSLHGEHPEPRAFGTGEARRGEWVDVFGENLTAVQSVRLGRTYEPLAMGYGYHGWLTRNVTVLSDTHLRFQVPPDVLAGHVTVEVAADPQGASRSPFLCCLRIVAEVPMALDRISSERAEPGGELVVEGRNLSHVKQVRIVGRSPWQPNWLSDKPEWDYTLRPLRAAVEWRLLNASALWLRVPSIAPAGDFEVLVENLDGHSRLCCFHIPGTALPTIDRVEGNLSRPGERLRVYGENLDRVGRIVINGTYQVTALPQREADGALSFSWLWHPTLGTARIIVHSTEGEASWCCILEGVPRLSGFAPIRVAPGGRVLVTGENFSRVTQAAYGDLGLNFTVINDSLIELRFPFSVSDFSSREVTLTSPFGSGAKRGLSITDDPAYGRFLRIEPATARPGDTVRILGEGLDPLRIHWVILGYYPEIPWPRDARAHVESSTSLRFVVPMDAAGGTYPLETGGGGSPTICCLTVKAPPPPLARAFSVTEARRGETVFVHGESLGNVTTVVLYEHPIEPGDYWIMSRLEEVAWARVDDETLALHLGSNLSLATHGVRVSAQQGRSDLCCLRLLPGPARAAQPPSVPESTSPPEELPELPLPDPVTTVAPDPGELTDAPSKATVGGDPATGRPTPGVEALPLAALGATVALLLAGTRRRHP
ncbi:MAG TPA: hypothetical protein VNZ52_16790 [Candidatus Thermoplasmatota archaeon]|nr:hypothetical protein [Candidatus Thermoplasmatota archaeon]